MSTITREFTKEQLIEHIKGRKEFADECAADSTLHPERGEYYELTAEALRIALASLEAEAVGFIARHKETGKFGSYLHPKADWFKNDNYEVLSAYTAPPSPVVDADDNFYSWFGREWHEHYQQNQYTTAAKQMLGVMAESAWKAGRRAAMLQGVEQQNRQQNFPENIPVNTPCKEAPEHIRLQTAGVWPENGEFSELTWCSYNQHQDDTLYVRADVVAGNSPVIPDGLNIRAVAALRESVRNQWLKSDEFAEKIYWKNMHDIANEIVVAMLAAAPQQEV